MDLIIKTGSRHLALGLITEAWIIAQNNWLKYNCIPEKAWSDELNVLIDVNLATRRADGTVYVKGSKKAFAWLTQKSELGRKGGLNSGKSRRSKSLKQNEAHASSSEAPASFREAERSCSKPPSLTLTPSLTLNNNYNTNTTTVARSSRQRQQPMTFNSLDELLNSFDKETLRAWGSLYPDTEFLRRQALKAWEWYRVNPIKTPKTIKGWHRAFSHWFESDWTKHIKTINSNKPSSKIDIEDILRQKDSV